MKKTLVMAAFAIAFGLTSCGSDDVQDAIDDVACQNQTLASRGVVEAAISAYEAAETTTTCESLKQAIENYREFECIPDDAFATEYNSLPSDCSTLGNGV